MFSYRHCAVNIKTGEIISTGSVNHLNRMVALTNRLDRKYGDIGLGQWRFCHDFGKSWDKNGLPQQ